MASWDRLPRLGLAAGLLAMLCACATVAPEQAPDPKIPRNIRQSLVALQTPDGGLDVAQLSSCDIAVLDKLRSNPRLKVYILSPDNRAATGDYLLYMDYDTHNLWILRTGGVTARRGLYGPMAVLPAGAVHTCLGGHL